MGIINEITEQIYMYYGEAVFLIAAIISYVYLAVKEADIRRKLLYPVGLIMFCVVNPILYKFVFSTIIYWRLFWMFPDAVIIAYAATRFIKNQSKKWHKLAACTAFAALILLTGNNVFKNADYVTTENWYKIPAETKEVCDIILEADDNPRCIMPQALYSDARQYSGEIELLYGRNADGFIIDTSYELKSVLEEAAKESPNYEYIFFIIKSAGCNWYVADSNDNISESALIENGYSLFDYTQTYKIYHCESIEESEGWRITQYGKDIENYGLRSGYTIEDGKGGLIIVDGGPPWGTNRLKEIIASYDNHVTAWIITDFEQGRVGSFLDIMGSENDINVDMIYTGYIDYDNINPDDGLVQDFVNVVKDNYNVSYLSKGDKLEICGLSIDVLTGNNINDRQSSDDFVPLSFIVQGNIQNMLFLSDTDEDVEDDIIDYFDGNYDVDYLQTAYSGRRWRLEKLYACIEPEVVFMDIQQFLISNEKCDAGAIISYFKDKGACIYDFTTVPNRVILK